MITFINIILWEVFCTKKSMIIIKISKENEKVIKIAMAGPDSLIF